MPGIIIVGLQWGDEGKGKIVDRFSQRASHVVRSQGGNNAGHTIKTENQELSLHLLPSGILNPQAQVYIGGGCLIDPKVLIQEIKDAEEGGVDLVSRLHISPYAHVIFPFHIAEDQMQEEKRGSGAIGTTGRGIGPSATDRVARQGLRVAELIRPDVFEERLRNFCAWKQVDSEVVFEEYSAYGELLRGFVHDVEGRLNHALIRDETVLFEGAHGTLLDTNFGSYPFVTSSSCLSAGVCAGAGVGPRFIDEVFGVMKAYTTRVGSGPLPTTVDPDTLDDFKEAENFREVGTTTGRERRIGWLDLVLIRHSIELNGVSQLALTKLDVLDQLPEIAVCVGYELDGEKIDKPPPLIEDWARMEPVYEVVPGWQVPTKDCRKVRELPPNARAYIEMIEDFCNVPIGVISVGPSREETIEVDEEWM